MADPKTAARIAPPTISCFPRLSVPLCSTITAKVAMHAGNSNPNAQISAARMIFSR
jgi:hypothetical protein